LHGRGRIKEGVQNEIPIFSQIQDNMELSLVNGIHDTVSVIEVIE
jgi:hypothetical protein